MFALRQFQPTFKSLLIVLITTQTLAGWTHGDYLEQDGRMLFDVDSSVPGEYTDQIAKAMSVWADHLGLSAQRRPDCEQATVIHFRFVAGDHGDRFPFQSGTAKVAHVISFRAGRQTPEVHFNSALFAPDNASRPNIYLVALHEIGHVIGLPHSSNHKSIMYPVYQEDGQILDAELNAIGRCLGAEPLICTRNSRSKILPLTLGDTVNTLH